MTDEAIDQPNASKRMRALREIQGEGCRNDANAFGLRKNRNRAVKHKTTQKGLMCFILH